jgi:hypothetical protein
MTLLRGIYVRSSFTYTTTARGHGFLGWPGEDCSEHIYRHDTVLCKRGHRLKLSL